MRVLKFIYNSQFEYATEFLRNMVHVQLFKNSWLLSLPVVN